jgi:hypothetical protein
MPGTPRKFMLEGNSYDLAADVDINEILTKFENSLIHTSGKPVLKQVKRSQDLTDVVLVTSGNDREQLRDFADNPPDGGLSASYTDADGNTYRFTCFINIDSNTTAEARTTIMLLPIEDRTADLA